MAALRAMDRERVHYKRRAGSTGVVMGPSLDPTRRPKGRRPWVAASPFRFPIPATLEAVEASAALCFSAIPAIGSCLAGESKREIGGRRQEEGDRRKETGCCCG